MIERSRVPIQAGAAGEIVFSKVNFCADSDFDIRSIPVQQSQVKDTGRSVKNAGGRLHYICTLPMYL